MRIAHSRLFPFLSPSPFWHKKISNALTSVSFLIKEITVKSSPSLPPSPSAAGQRGTVGTHPPIKPHYCTKPKKEEKKEEGERKERPTTGGAPPPPPPLSSSVPSETPPREERRARGKERREEEEEITVLSSSFLFPVTGSQKSRGKRSLSLSLPYLPQPLQLLRAERGGTTSAVVKVKGSSFLRETRGKISTYFSFPGRRE